MATITEDYVSFEAAKLLKEKGFNGRTIYGYIKNNDTVTDCCYCNIPGYPNDYEYNNTKITGHYVYAAPTLQMAMKWLREVYHIAIVVTPSIFWGKYNVSIYKRGNDYPYGFDGGDLVPSYEGACEAAIKYCLENLI